MTRKIVSGELPAAPCATIVRDRRWKLAAVLTAAALVLLIQRYFGVRLAPAVIRAHVDRFGILAPVVFIGFHALAPLVFFPASILSASALLAFGWKAGFVYVTIGSNLCSNLMFWIGRSVGQERVQGLTRNRFREYEDRLVGAGFRAVLMLRLIPMSPYHGIGYGAGVTRVKWRDYFWGTLLGMAPGTALFLYAGGRLELHLPQLLRVLH